MADYAPPGTGPGVIVCGSHVELTSMQLDALLEEPGVSPVEVDVEAAVKEPGNYEARITDALSAALARGLSPVLYTSRRERRFDSKEERLSFGRQVSRFLVQIVRGVPEGIGFIISKGGITSNDVLSSGLALSSVEVVGQIVPGVTVVRTPEDHRMPALPVVIFPGNVGERESLRTVYRRLTRLPPRT
jgi:uncharacterized protein YgbK (DUF1537 family)